jgi:Uma2 family endonuclease
MEVARWFLDHKIQFSSIIGKANFSIAFVPHIFYFKLTENMADFKITFGVNMANSIATAPVETAKPYAVGDTFIAKKKLPLEQRADVTVEELEQMSLPVPAELYNGKVVFKMASHVHSVIQAAVAGEIYIYLKTNPVGVVSTDENYVLWPERKNQSRIPDVSFVAKDRLPKEQNRFLPIAPDLAVEILSPTNNFDEVMLKAEEYLQQGTQIVWVVIVSTREVIVCTAEGKHFVKDVLTAPQLLPGFELPVKTIFAGL